MKKIESSLERIKEDIKAFYDYKIWHFITINGVGLADDSLELQWIFSKYDAMDEVVVYFILTDYERVVPTVEDIIPSALISQREVVDMFGIKVEGSEKGLYLDEDSKEMPLRGCHL